MTEAQKIQKEMFHMMADFRKNKAANTVECGALVTNRTYTYRKTTIIKAKDLAL